MSLHPSLIMLVFAFQVHESRIQVFHEKFLSKYKHKATKNMKYGIVKALEVI